MPKRDCFRLMTGTPRMIAGTDEGEVMLYGEIVPDYSKYYKEAYPQDKSAADFDQAIKQIKADGAKRLLLRINSPGGIVTQAVAMRAILAGAGFEAITIRIEGLCASAATIPATLPGAKVIITPGSEYMIHNPWSWAVGNANEMEKTVEHLRSLEASSRGFYAAKTGQSQEQIKSWMDAETWLSAEDAVKYGFADELAAEGNSESQAAACVSKDVMSVMRGLYKAVPEQIAVKDEGKEPDCHAGTPISSQQIPLPTPSATPPPEGRQDGRAMLGPTVRNDKDEKNPTVSADALTAPFRQGGQEEVSNGTPVAGAPTEIDQNEEEQKTMEINELTAEQLQAQNPALFNQVQQNAVQAERERLAEIDAMTTPGYEKMAAKAKADGTSAMDFHKQIVQAMKEKGAGFLQQRREETNPAQEVAGAAAGGQANEQKELDDFARSMAEFAKNYVSSEGGMF